MPSRMAAAQRRQWQRKRCKYCETKVVIMPTSFDCNRWLRSTGIAAPQRLPRKVLGQPGRARRAQSRLRVPPHMPGTLT